MKNVIYYETKEGDVGVRYIKTLTQNEIKQYEQVLPQIATDEEIKFLKTAPVQEVKDKIAEILGLVDGTGGA